MDKKGRFTPGDPRAGRPKGAISKTGREARELAQKLVTDPQYLANLQQRLRDGKAGDLEKVLWQYAFGPPPERPVTVLDTIDLLPERLDGLMPGLSKALT